jgi:molybdopterin molybdotransferase
MPETNLGNGEECEMLSVAEAVELILAESRPLQACPASLDAARGLRLAEEVHSDVDSPPFDKSMMDGYAVRSEDVPETPAELRVLGELTAGGEFGGEIGPGEALQIMTGAPIPRGADAVVRFEDAQRDGEQVRIVAGTHSPGTNVIPQGVMMRRGDRVLGRGTVLRAQELAVLAELGRGEVLTHPRPRVAVLATGDELVPPGAPLGPGQIRNSNETMLVAQVRGWGVECDGLGIARDRLEELRSKIEEGLRRDVLILTGGVSMGTRDLVPKVLTELGAREVFHKVRLKPGKPAWFGVWEGGTEERPLTRPLSPMAGAREELKIFSGGEGEGPRALIFALPGNPVSSMVCSDLFVRPAVHALSGDSEPRRSMVQARLTHRFEFRDDRPTYFPAWIETRLEGRFATPVPWKGSADLRSTIEANGVIAFPAGERDYEEGEAVEVVLWQ